MNVWLIVSVCLVIGWCVVEWSRKQKSPASNTFSVTCNKCGNSTIFEPDGDWSKDEFGGNVFAVTGVMIDSHGLELQAIESMNGNRLICHECGNHLGIGDDDIRADGPKVDVCEESTNDLNERMMNASKMTSGFGASVEDAVKAVSKINVEPDTHGAAVEIRRLLSLGINRAVDNRTTPEGEIDFSDVVFSEVYDTEDMKRTLMDYGYIAVMGAIKEIEHDGHAYSAEFFAEFVAWVLSEVLCVTEFEDAVVSVKSDYEKASDDDLLVCVSICPELDDENMKHCRKTKIQNEDYWVEHGTQCPCGNTPEWRIVNESSKATE